MLKLLLIPVLACLGGCWWGGILGADITAQVNNKTDKSITVVPVGDTYDDAIYEPQRQEIGRGKSGVFTYDATESNPQLRVDYGGATRIIDVDYDFWGMDEIDITKDVFVGANG